MSDRREQPAATAATVDLVAVVTRQADRIAWLQGDVAGWRIKLAAAQEEIQQLRRDTPAWAFTDALLALQELGHQDVADRLRARWPEVDVKAAA
jgi:hypothetical protein